MDTQERLEIKEQLSSSERYVLEVISGDRKAHSIHFQNINQELTGIKNHQEVLLLKVEQLTNLVQVDKCATCGNNKDIKAYKNKMRPYEMLVEYKRIPLYTCSVLFLSLIWEKLPYVWIIVKTKILGL